MTTPTYNRAEFLERAITSVKNQSYENYEHWIVDDGSTDNTEEIVKSLHYSRLHYTKFLHKGCAAISNNCWDIACRMGDVWTWLASDDEFLPDKLAVDAKNFDNGTDVVYGNYTDDDGYEVPTFIEKTFLKVHLLTSFGISFASIAVRTSVLKEMKKRYGYYTDDKAFRLMNDWDFMLRLLTVTTRIKHTGESHALYHKHPGQGVVNPKFLEEYGVMQERLMSGYYDFVWNSIS